MLARTRFDPLLTCRIPVSHIGDVPSSLLVPERLLPVFGALLNQTHGRAGILLRLLVEGYSEACYAGEFPQRGSLRSFYQSPGQKLFKYSFRVENAVWLQFGQMAAYLGVSRCYLFSYLLELAARDCFEAGVGTPTRSYYAYDLRHPRFIEYRIRYYPEENLCERLLQRSVMPEWDVPYYIRYEVMHR